MASSSDTSSSVMNGSEAGSAASDSGVRKSSALTFSIPNSAADGRLEAGGAATSSSSSTNDQASDSVKRFDASSAGFFVSCVAAGTGSSRLRPAPSDATGDSSAAGSSSALLSTVSGSNELSRKSPS